MILLILILLFAALFLCGYTTIRFPARKNENKKRVACVGDSVTYGCTLPLFFRSRYPARLQRMLGEEYQVGVFAVNDRTLQDSGNKPFRREIAFRQSKAFDPDIVVILLGTNDSKDNNWRSADQMEQEYLRLIEEYRALSSDPRVLLCTPPCAFKPINRFFYITNDAVLDRIPEIAAIAKDAAEKAQVDVVDLFTSTSGHREFFSPDGLHPSAKGAEAIASAVFRAICDRR